MKSKFSLILGYLNRALNNPALVITAPKLQTKNQLGETRKFALVGFGYMGLFLPC